METNFESNVELLEGPFYVILKWIQLGPEDFNKNLLTLLYSVIKYVHCAVDISKCQTVSAVKNYLVTARVNTKKKNFLLLTEAHPIL
jgi:hypothetical protein